MQAMAASMAEEETEVQSKVTVAVRVKPLDRDDRNAELCVAPHEQNPSCTIVVGGGSKTMRGSLNFTFDFCHWSLGDHPMLLGMAHRPKEATQATIYHDVGLPVVRNALHGFNCSIFAYGQTGSGKTYTMMGDEDGHERSELRGLIPRISEALFAQTVAPSSEDGPPPSTIDEAAAMLGRFTVSHFFTVSYIEIYMEKVQDLLGNDDTPQSLRVREHPKNGPYVEGIVSVTVSSFDDIKAVIDRGNSNRMVASTCMNSVSSRSHAVFTIQYTKRKVDVDSGATLDMTSKLNLIDLAGSENANSAGTTGERLKEGSYINKSLLTLGMVIKALAEKASKTDAKTKTLVPYRDSVLTFLLRDSLGGNSRTTMVATVRPGAAFMEETLSTLRYADRAKSIMNYAVINEDPLTKRIRELQEMIEKLAKELASSQEREQEKSRRIADMNEQLIAALARGANNVHDSAKHGSPTHQGSSETDSANNQNNRGVGRSRLSPPPSYQQRLDLVVAAAAAAGSSSPPRQASPRQASPPPPPPPRTPPAGERLPSPRSLEGGPDPISSSVTPPSPRPLAVDQGEDDHPNGVHHSMADYQNSPRPFVITLKEIFAVLGDMNSQQLAKRSDSKGASGSSHHTEDERDTRVLAYTEEEQRGAGEHTPNTATNNQPLSPPSPRHSSSRGHHHHHHEDDDQEGNSTAGQSSRRGTQEGRSPGPEGADVSAGSVSRVGDGLAVTSAVKQDALRLQGFLLKKGRFNRALRRRWFVQKGTRLLWYKRYNAPESLRGGLMLVGASVDEVSPATNTDSSGGSEPFCFTVKEDASTPQCKQWFLQASSEEEQVKWVQSLRKATSIKRTESGDGDDHHHHHHHHHHHVIGQVVEGADEDDEVELPPRGGCKVS